MSSQFSEGGEPSFFDRFSKGFGSSGHLDCKQKHKSGIEQLYMNLGLASLKQSKINSFYIVFHVGHEHLQILTVRIVLVCF